MRRIAAFFVAYVAISTTASGQNQALVSELPQIVVTGHGEVKVTPDRATLQISVQSRARTAAEASAENANKQTAVIAAIRKLGINDEQISTSNFSVTPEQKYEPNLPPVVTGYVVTNTVVVEVWKIANVGPVLDAALSNGANLISGLNFYSSSTQASRRAAIALAVSSARGDAEAAARAAGGSLGALLELSVGSYSPPMPRPMMAMRSVSAESMQADTPISAGLETVSVEVSTRWKFLPAN